MTRQIISVEFAVSPELHAELRAAWKPEDGAAIIQGIDNEFIAKKNYRRVFERNQSTWKPLNREYRAWKERRGFSQKIWQMTGATLRALSSPVKITTAGGSILGRRIAITRNTAGVIEAEWTITKPAAGGYFAANNVVRPFLNEVLPEVQAGASAVLQREALAVLGRAGFEVVSST